MKENTIISLNIGDDNFGFDVNLESDKWEKEYLHMMDRLKSEGLQLLKSKKTTCQKEVDGSEG